MNQSMLTFGRGGRLKVILVSSLFIVPISCSIFEKDDKKNPNGDGFNDITGVSFLQLDFDESKIEKAASEEKSGQLHKLYKSIGEQTEYFEVLKAYTDILHGNAYRKDEANRSQSDEEIGKSIKSAFDDSVALANAQEAKPKFEDWLIKSSTFTEISYDREHSSYYSYLLEGLMQCYSGTTLAMRLLMEHGQDKFRSFELVAIFTEGHVLFGQMEKNDDGYELVGIETTVAGKGLVKFGNTKELHNLSKPLRVVTAEHFLLIEALDEYIVNQNNVKNLALEFAANRYSIDWENLEKKIEATHGKIDLEKEDTQSNAVINESIFAFGKSTAPSGRQSRLAADEIPVDAVLGSQGQFRSQGLATVVVEDILDPEQEKKKGIFASATQLSFDTNENGPLATFHYNPHFDHLIGIQFASEAIEQWDEAKKSQSKVALFSGPERLTDWYDGSKTLLYGFEGNTNRMIINESFAVKKRILTALNNRDLKIGITADEDETIEYFLDLAGLCKDFPESFMGLKEEEGCDISIAEEFLEY